MSERVAIVTGAARGIGAVLAERLATDGLRVVAVDRIPHAEAAASGGSGDGAQVAVADVTDPAAVQRVVDQTVERWGRVDVLVNNAAVSLGGAFLDVSREAWQRTLDVNLTGAFLCGQAVARTMAERSIAGRIVNVSSVNALAAERGAAAYVASKGGIDALTRAMAVDLAPYGIAVNGVAPGPIRTEVTGPIFDEPAYRAGIELGVPAGRAGTAAEVAAAVAFLASPEASFVTGATLVVDGGFRAYARLADPDNGQGDR